MMLTLSEIQALIPVIDAGIKAGGLQVFQNEGGVKLQSALNKLQAMAEEEEQTEPEEEKDG